MANEAGRDRLRELLDAVLDDGDTSLRDMADRAYSSPFHFSRQLSRRAGESPVAMRRRVMLERAAWQLRHGATVTDAAFAADYDSVEGFSRAFARAYGHLPSQVPAASGHWLPAPNGIHFHPPTSLWADAREERSAQGVGTGAGEVTALLVHHDLADVRLLLVAATGLDDVELGRVRWPDHVVLAYDGPDASIADVLHHLVASKEVWLASIVGEDTPQRRADDGVAALIDRHDAVAPRWLATIREIDRRGGWWGDRLIDALCDPPESFVLGGVLAHVLTFSASRRQLARQWLREVGALAAPTGAGTDDGTDQADPINWLRHRMGGEP